MWRDENYQQSPDGIVADENRTGKVGSASSATSSCLTSSKRMYQNRLVRLFEDDDASLLVV